MDLGLAGAVAFVAASTKGLGRAVAEGFADEGAHVVCSSRTQEDVQETTAALTARGTEAHGVVCDLHSKEEIQAAIAAAVAVFGRLDTVVVNAGGPPVGSWTDIDDDGWAEAVNLTLMSAVWLIRAAITHLEESTIGSITVISSTSIREPIPNLVLSNALRLAVAGLAKSLSRELAPKIRINTVLPGRFLTDRTRDRAKATPGGLEQFIAAESKSVPLGRFGACAELASAVTFLASPRSAYTTGATLAVDGGIIHTPL